MFCYVIHNNSCYYCGKNKLLPALRQSNTLCIFVLNFANRLSWGRGSNVIHIYWCIDGVEYDYACILHHWHRSVIRLRNFSSAGGRNVHTIWIYRSAVSYIGSSHISISHSPVSHTSLLGITDSLFGLDTIHLPFISPMNMYESSCGFPSWYKGHLPIAASLHT